MTTVQRGSRSFCYFTRPLENYFMRFYTVNKFLPLGVFHIYVIEVLRLYASHKGDYTHVRELREFNFGSGGLVVLNRIL